MSMIQAIQACRQGQVSHQQGQWRAGYRPGPDFPGFAGHFPGHPVLPALVQVLMAMETIEAALGRPLRLQTLAQAKFSAPVRPGMLVEVWTRPLDGLYWDCQIKADGQEAARLKLRLKEG